MSLFDFFKKKHPNNQGRLDRPPLAVEYADKLPMPLKMAEAMRYFEMFLESVEIVSKTVYCKTFFYRYDVAVENAKKVLQFSKGLDNEKAAQDMMDILVSEKTNIVNDFLFRCYDAGKIGYVEKDIIPYMAEVPQESKKLLQTMLECEGLDQVSEHPNSCAGLFALLLGAQLLTGLAFPSNHSHYCNGDCDNCPPHYGYRYCRWYYGHGHQGGCERGGNGGSRGLTLRD